MTKEDIKLENLRHKNRMEEIESERKAKLEVEAVKFDYFKQLQRIKSAEIFRTKMIR